MPWPMQPDGTFWPWFIIVAVSLFLAGAMRGKWKVPALALSGEVAAILIFKYAAFPPVTLCTSWLFFAYMMAYNGGKVPAFFYALAGLSSGLLYVFGIGLIPFGPSPIVIDIFSAMALLSVGGGIFGISSGSRSARPRLLRWNPAAEMGVSSCEASGSDAIEGRKKVIR